MKAMIRSTLKSVARSIFSLAPTLKLIPPPSQRPNGISVMIRVFDEQQWIGTCLAALRGFADEILIGDAGSTDGTLETIQNYCNAYPTLQISEFDCSNMSFIEKNNFLLHKTRYRWVMRFDGDQIAHTTGLNAICNLRRYLMSLNPALYYGITLSYPQLFLDPFHAHKSSFGREIWLHTYHHDVCYYQMTDKDYVGLLWFPWFFKVLELPNPFVFHCNIKSKERMLDRIYWRQWTTANHSRYPTLKSVALDHLKQDFGTDDYEAACDENLRRSFSQAVPYPKDKFGEYPALIKQFLKRPPYLLIYDQQKITKRSDMQ